MMLRASTILLLLLAILTSTTATPQRDTRCDDAVPLRASCNFALTDDPQVLFHCDEAEILAQQTGCYRCVDAGTCRHRRDYAQVGVLPHVVHKDAHTPKIALAPSPSAWPLQQIAAATLADESTALAVESDEVDIDLPFIPDALSTAESAEFNAASVRFSRAARQVSTWYFLAPVVLAIVSLGLAVRSRVQRDRDARFERMDACDREDEINPFCESLTNPQDDGNDGDDRGVEFVGGRYVVNEDDDEDTSDDGHEHEHVDLEGAGCDGASQDVDDDCGFAIVVSSSPSTFST